MVQHVDSKSTEEEHIDSDAALMTTQIGMLMQMWPSLNSLAEMCELSNQLMKVLHKRRELCLKPTSKAEVPKDQDIDITPL